MTYTRTNYRTKKALKDAVAAGDEVYVFEPGLGALPKDGGYVFLEGPHFPEPHRWYAQVLVDATGKITKIIS